MIPSSLLITAGVIISQQLPETNIEKKKKEKNK